MSRFKVGQVVVGVFPVLGDVLGVVTEVHKSLLLPMSSPEYAPGVTIRVTQATDVWQVGDLFCSHDSDIRLVGDGNPDCLGPSAARASGDCDGPDIEGTDVLDSAIELAICGVDFDSDLAWACDVRPGRPYPLKLSADWSAFDPCSLVAMMDRAARAGTPLGPVRIMGGDCDGNPA